VTKPINAAHFEHDRPARVMVPANARPAHRRLRQKLAEIAAWNEGSSLNTIVEGQKNLGMITSGISYVHIREAAPEASLLKLGMTYPLPIEKIRAFAQSVERCVVIEEGIRIWSTALRAEGIAVEGKAEMYRFGELDVTRIRRILNGDHSPEPAPVPGKAPCYVPAVHTGVCSKSCATWTVSFRAILAVTRWACSRHSTAWIPAFAWELASAWVWDYGTCLPEAQARRVVSVIGDSTFIHSGLTGLAEMVL